MLNCITHEDEKSYHSRSRSGEFVSSHLLQLFCRSPWKYYATISGENIDEDRPEFAFGRAVHKLILEGRDAFSHEYMISDGPVNPRTGSPYGKTSKAYLDWAALQRKEVVTTEDFEAIVKMMTACDLHRGIHELLASYGEAEGVVRAELEGVPCQIRMDYFSEEVGIVDLKTCRDIEFFENDCRNFGYAYQLAFYRSVLKAASGISVPVHIIAVDKTEFNIAGRWDIPDVVLDECDKVNRAALLRLKKCRETNVWPTGYETTRVFALHKD